MNNSESVILSGEVRRETERAILFFDGAREVWIPKSQILDRYDYSDSVEITITLWIAEQKELV